MFELSPLNRRRLKKLKDNSRGWVSFKIFLLLLIITLPAEFVANDKPILVWYEGNAHFPVFKKYTEMDFGGELEILPDYKDPYIKELINEKGFMLWPLIPHSFDSIDLAQRTPAPSPPDSSHWLGTDDQGRDLLARLIYGFRTSVWFALILVFFASIVGILAGAVQGYFGGLIDLLAQRALEIWGSMPRLYILIILSSFFIPGFWTLLGILLLFSWVALTGVVRVEVLRVRNFKYVQAARALGVSELVIMNRHVLPNAMVATFTFLPFNISGAVVAITVLDFLGLGLPPGTASLGELLRQGKANLHAPWLGVTAFMSVACTLSLLVFVGEACRDAFDPRKVQNE